MPHIRIAYLCKIKHTNKQSLRRKGVKTAFPLKKTLLSGEGLNCWHEEFGPYQGVQSNRSRHPRRSPSRLRSLAHVRASECSHLLKKRIWEQYSSRVQMGPI